MKRKFELDDEPVVTLPDRPIKHARVFLGHTTSEDIAMDDASSESCTTSTTESPTIYPKFNLYPFPAYGQPDVDMAEVTPPFSVTTAESRTSSNVSVESNHVVGLLQPKSSFLHNYSNCYQIPRLRVACEAGLGGQRTLWTQCDQCGAIEMIGGTD